MTSKEGQVQEVTIVFRWHMLLLRYTAAIFFLWLQNYASPKPATSLSSSLPTPLLVPQRHPNMAFSPNPPHVIPHRTMGKDSSRM